jgi:hypothetical protein
MGAFLTPAVAYGTESFPPCFDFPGRIPSVGLWSLEFHAATFADQLAGELTGKGDAALEAACGTLRAELSRQLPESMAFGLTAGFAALVRDRLAPIL